MDLIHDHRPIGLFECSFVPCVESTAQPWLRETQFPTACVSAPKAVVLLIHPQYGSIQSFLPSPPIRFDAHRWAVPEPPSASAAATLPDLFSSLPDDVLLAIASRLPTRKAFSLSVLARRLRHLPTLFGHRDSISLSLPDFPIPLYTNPPILLRRLAISPSRSNRISTFRPVFDAAIDHGVSELVIRLPRRMRLPKSVLSIRSLTVLYLDNCVVPHSSIVACTCLRTLKLTRAAIPQAILTAVLAAASRLETLEMMFCTGFRGVCSVESSTVGNFVFRPVLEQRETMLKVTGLMTVTLYTRPTTQSVQLAPAPGVRKAYLHVAKPRHNLKFKIRPFLDADTDLTSLTLRDFAMPLLSIEYENALKLPTTFQNLRMLSVSLDLSCRSETVFMVKLLESCPSLQHFTISTAESKKKDTALCFADHKGRLAKVSCIPNLVQFNFLGFRDEQYQRELFVFLLNRTRKLKLSVRFLENTESTVRWILSVKRAPVEKRSKKYNHCHLELVYPDS